MDPLFPELPEDLAGLSDEDLATLLQEHEVAAELIDNEDESFTQGLGADDILAEYERGVEQIETIRAEQDNRVQAQEEYLAAKSALSERRKGDLSVAEDADEEASDESDEEESEEEGEEEAAAEGDEAEAELAATETEEVEDEAEEAEEEEEQVGSGEKKAVTASAVSKTRPLRRPPSPSAERAAKGAPGAPVLSAPGHLDMRGGQVLDRITLAKAMKTTATRRGKPSKSVTGVEERILIASANYPFPDERRLVSGDWEVNAEKIRQLLPLSIPGTYGNMALVASGGLCAPLEPIYTMPNFASNARPVRDALPSFQADRGGVNVPAATYIADITSAITVIEESEDALGGTFATKSCQDLSCPAYTETAITIISHCREYGNLNAMAWPEKIAHENDLTMAAHARTAETYLLDRIKALSINVTQAAIGAQVHAFGSLVYGITRAAAGTRFRLRMTPGSRFRALIPAWVLDLLAADNAFMQVENRYEAQAALGAALERYGISASYYLDDVTGGTSQGFAAETASAIDDFPDEVQMALFAEGAFLHIDSGSLELGIVRDSTLNSTNDFQIFGESFENVARLGPAQSALWLTVDVCPSGAFPSLVSGLTC